MGPTNMAVAGGLGALVVLSGCGAQAGDAAAAKDELSAQHPAQRGTAEERRSAADGTGVFVYNTHGDEQGRADQEPEALTASEFTTFTGLDWRTWEGDSAVAEGEVAGTWCLPECQDDPYSVTVELGDPETTGGTTYFSGYSVTDPGDLPGEMEQRMEDADGGRLMLPAGE